MKGISTTLVIIVTAIVILVAALVVLTIFGGGITPIVDLTRAKSMCVSEGAIACTSTGNLPTTWYAQTKTVGSERTPMSCYELLSPSCKCVNNKLEGC
ncbi:MAG: hypothetical protein KAU24_02070 [Candidatus Aenigmarchaeota archaeon]|nr:hypothetical protein [Candidatus Aenigmarchaeota archaeon]